MPSHLMTMFHVPDVAATADWYERLGFAVIDRGSDGRDVVFARLRLHGADLLLSAGGRPAEAARRDADLYIECDDVEGALAALPPGVELIEPLHDSFYGMREFIVRDPNGFWITFGQRPQQSQKAMGGE